ncbi:MAG: glycosyltransferase family 2 protein [Planctomycetales bacterium]|nr:glycosyltransferase family 2 protein [Planctomycetales bacterium]
MTRLSIVVACFNRVDLLEETLIAVLQNRPRQSEVVVVHDGRYTDPYDLKEEVRFVSVAADSSWVGSLNAGIDQSEGEIVHVLGAGVLPEANWADAALEPFSDHAVGSVCPVLLGAGESTKIRCLGVGLGPLLGRKVLAVGREWNENRPPRVTPLGPNLVAAFYRREALLAAGGLTEDYGDELADIDLAYRLEDVGYDLEVAYESHLRVDVVDRPRRHFAAQGRQHQQLIASLPDVASWKKTVAKWGQVALDCVTSPVDPRRLLSAWGRITTPHNVEPHSAEPEPTAAVYSLADHRDELSAPDNASHRRAA